MSIRPEVLVDLFPGLHPAGGIGRYVRDLVDALLHDPDAPPARFAYPRNLRAQAHQLVPAERLHELPLAWRPLSLMLAATVRAGIPLDRLYGRPAVMHSVLGYGPRFASTRLIDHVHDLTFLEHPEWHPVHTRLFLSACVPPAARAAEVVLTHSEHVRRRVIEVLGITPERTVVIPPPLSRAFVHMTRPEAAALVKERFRVEGPYVLHVGTIEPRKNHAGLVDAFERMRRAGFPGPLILVGKPGWSMRPILARIEGSPEEAYIVRVGGVAERDLVALYAACTACAFPSLDEGFGMPLLESMACGVPCVISDQPALVELADGHAVIVPTGDAGSLADALLRLWRDDDERGGLGERGRLRAEGYRFRAWALRLFDLYRRELSAAEAA